MVIKYIYKSRYLDVIYTTDPNPIAVRVEDRDGVETTRNISISELEELRDMVAEFLEEYSG